MGGAYLLAALGLSAGIAELVNLFDLDLWVARTFTIVAIFGFPIAMGLAWRYELTPDGVVTDDVASARAAEATDDSLKATTIILNKGKEQILVFWKDGAQSRSNHFTEKFLIGRDPTSGVHVPNPAVSRQHAKVWRVSGQWWIEDLNTPNGTFIDGKRITKHLVGSGTEVSLSEHGPVLRFEIPEASTSDSAATLVQEG